MLIVKWQINNLFANVHSAHTDEMNDFPLSSPGCGPEEKARCPGLGWSGEADSWLSVCDRWRDWQETQESGDQESGGQHHVQGAGHHEGELLRPGPGAGRHAQEVKPGESREDLIHIIKWL